MTTNEDLVTDRVRAQLGLTPLIARVEFAVNENKRHYAEHALKEALAELGQRYVHAVVQLELEVGGLEPDDPGLTEYARGLTAALHIVRGTH